MNLMGIDIGTTGCKAAVFDAKGVLLALDYREYDIIRSLPGQAELDCAEVWDKICQVTASCSTKVKEIKAVSVTSMGEAMVPVDLKGTICGTSILGADTRGIKYLDKLTVAIPADEIYQITGQPARAGYALPNLCRIKNEEPELYRRTFKFLTWADFVAYMLTGKMHTNYPLATRTLFFDHRKCCWSQDIAVVTGFDLEKLPPPLPSGTLLGQITHAMSRKLGLPQGLQVVSGSHDQCAAVIGAGMSEAGTAMLGLGTYACMVIINSESGVDSTVSEQSLNIEPHAIPDQYISLIYHGSGGALLKWLRDEMFRDLKGNEIYQQMDDEAELAENPAVVLPYFAETGPMDYKSGEHGLVGGLSFANTRGDILKGALAGIIFYFKEAFEKLNEDGWQIRRLHVSGGGAESPLWRQMIADILGIPVVKSNVRECGALGAAIIAGVGCGYYRSFDKAVAEMVKAGETSLPIDDNKNRFLACFERYLKLKNAVLTCNLSLT